MNAVAVNRPAVVDSRVVVAARPVQCSALSSVRANAGRPLMANFGSNTIYQDKTRSTERGMLPVVAARRDGDRFDRGNDGFQDRVIQVRRVTKVVKGGKQLRFRAVVRRKDSWMQLISPVYNCSWFCVAALPFLDSFLSTVFLMGRICMIGGGGRLHTPIAVAKMVVVRIVFTWLIEQYTIEYY